MQKPGGRNFLFIYILYIIFLVYLYSVLSLSYYYCYCPLFHLCRMTIRVAQAACCVRIYCQGDILFFASFQGNGGMGRHIYMVHTRWWSENLKLLSTYLFSMWCGRWFGMAYTHMDVISRNAWVRLLCKILRGEYNNMCVHCPYICVYTYRYAYDTRDDGRR